MLWTGSCNDYTGRRLGAVGQMRARAKISSKQLHAQPRTTVPPYIRSMEVHTTWNTLLLVLPLLLAAATPTATQRFRV